MACRFPGANDVAAFWRLLEAGENAVAEGVPGSGAGRIGELFRDVDVQNEACRFAALIDDVDQFDAAFFRISPIEAQLLDPQQRLMLETSWQALEDAGINPDTLQGSRIGVYGGISNNDYRGLVLEASDPAGPASSLYAVSGSSYNTAIGRVAFALGFRGPAIAIDTACSSSLVAIHQAVTGLRQGEADLALAGGVHTILSGRLMALRANAGMLAPDGRCKTFDAAANGYVRGEGCGILVLKRLREAEADGDRVWGVIRGSALNQDGASTGLTVPSEEAQEQVIVDALRRSGVLPSQVDYVEAHGTGTSVGDPIELRAVAAAYGDGHSAAHPLLIGSVKTNFGHLESAAGVAAVMKVLLAMRHGVIPKHRNFRNPTPAVDWQRLPLRVTSTATEWPFAPDQPPLAGVNGFGWSGTNAHVVVEGYGTPERPATGFQGKRLTGRPLQVAISLPEAVADPLAAQELPPRAARLLPLSGKTHAALRELAGRYLSWLGERGVDLAPANSAADAWLSDVAWTAGIGRSQLPHRAGIVFKDAESLRTGLQAVADGDRGSAPGAAAKVAFVYTGQGSQWVGMGKMLYEREPVVRAVLDRCEAVMAAERGASLLDVMFGSNPAAGDMYDTVWAQPAVYALECALTALWRSIGVEPGVVIGHSLGEYAAAQAAGVFSLEDGLRFVAKRGALLASVPELGSMAAVFAPEDKVAAAVRAHNAASDGPQLGIGVDNGTHQVISGPTAAVQALSEHFESEEIRVRPLRTNQAFHSVLVEPALDALEAAYEAVAASRPSAALVSNVTGRVIEPGETLDAQYWRRHARQAVQFRGGVGTMAELGVDVVIEIGPHAVLGPLVSLVWSDVAGNAREPTVLETMIRPSNDPAVPDRDEAFLEAVAGAYEAGLMVSFPGLFAGEERRRIELPGYPFQHERHWVEPPRRRRTGAGHPLLGTRHESPRGEVMFETEMFPSDPSWLNDHRVFGRVIMPGALHGAIAAAVSRCEGAKSVDVEDLQLHSPMVFAAEDAENETGRRVQAVLSASENGSARRIEIFSKGESEDGWTLHAEGKASLSPRAREGGSRIDVNGIRSGKAPQDVAAFYRARADANINLGPMFRTLQALWAGNGEAVGEVVLPEAIDRSGIDLHPLLLDGCFQVLSAARHSAGGVDELTYLPFGWERLWLTEPLPERVICHARMWENARAANDAPPEVLSGDLWFYTPDGVEVGGLSGYTVKRATRAALLAGTEGVQDLLYEVVWRDRPLAPAMLPADFLPSPTTVAARSAPYSRFLAAEGVEAEERAASYRDLERLSWSYALLTLDRLGWQRKAGETVEPDALRQRLQVVEEHGRLFRRILEILAQPGVVKESSEGFVVALGSGDPLPEALPGDAEAFATGMLARHPHCSTEVELFRRSGGALAEVLLGRADPLTLLFSGGEPSAADMYRRAPVWRAANRMLGAAAALLVDGLPEGRRLRVLEVGAGVGSATATVLPELPGGRFDYTYTDISAGFFAAAETRFSNSGAAIEYRPLDIEKDPVPQGFEPHAYDLVIAANVLHATRYLEETLTHCRNLLAPSGLLVALENHRGEGWLDLAFGQLDGWWRFADAYRTHHALVGPEAWTQALLDAGFEEIEILGPEKPASTELPDRGVIVARGPADVKESPGVWVLAGDCGGTAEGLAQELAARNQTVVLTGNDAPSDGPALENASGIVRTSVDMARRESWRSLIESLPAGQPLNGVVHLAALSGHGAQAATEELAADARRAGAGALALVQGIADADVTPAKGVWFVTRGAQVLEKERTGELVGAALWGFGKVAAREMPHLQPRMVDLAPGETAPNADLVHELMYPDAETHIAYRQGIRQVSRLVRSGSEAVRLTLPEESAWMLSPDAGGALADLQVEPLPPRPLESGDVRVAIEAVGLNFLDVFRGIGMIDTGRLGEEMCGRVIEVGAEVSTVSAGDRVVGFAFGTFGSEAVTPQELVALAPPGIPVTALATMPTVFVTAALSFDLAELKAGERVLIHAGAGGVGLAAIQLAHAAGAEVFATASAPKQAYLRSLGVKHVFDSRQTRFGREILEATGGEGVHVVLNSLTGEGFIAASLSCLARGGRFVELARLGILSEAEMLAARPDAAYSVLELDVLKERDPAQPGAALKNVMERLAAGELTPLVHNRWSLTEAASAMDFMRAARHVGKNVLTMPPLARGRLREDRTYLVTGGLGGIGCALAAWLADRGAGAIVLNGRRDPDPEAVEAIDALRKRGVRLQVELADVTDAAAVDAMLAHIDETLPPLAGIIHSVGVLSDGALTNQTWEKFEDVLWPKMLGAWQLHRATSDRDLDLFVVFSSITGVVGNSGQANHGAANAFLDQLVAHRRALGLAGQSIAWGAWSGLGEAEEQRERIEKQLEAVGTGWITPQQGLSALDVLMRQDVPASMVAMVDWPTFAVGHGDIPPFLEEVLPASASDAEEAKESPVDLLSQLRVSQPADAETILASFLQKELQAVMRLPTPPTPSVGFFDLGMDSLMAVELRNRLNRAFAGEYVVSNTAVFDYPDVTALARHLAGELGQIGAGGAPPAVPEAIVPERRPAAGRADDGIAIVGMACRFPGAKDLAEYWRLLESGSDAVTDGRPGAGDSATLRGAFVEGIEWFDSRFFRIAPIEARMMDPRQRMMLETTWQALEDAGIDPDGLRGSLTGVYAGVGDSEYRELIEASGSGGSHLGTTASVTAGRVAFALGLEGPAMAIDMACASALAAVHQAVAGLQRGEIDLALAGGVNAVLSPAVSRFMMEAGMLSRSGRCRPFDAAADGYVRGEGCGVVVLKRLSEAEADGDRIWAVIKGSAVNQNGASAGLTVPNGPAQERVMAAALAQAGIAGAEVDYLEAHAVGSQLGDAIEVRAVGSVYGQGREAERPLLMGTVKSNIGHLESAAGVAGLIKTVLAMKQGVIPKHLHVENPNPEIDWQRLPVRVTADRTDWPPHPGRPPRAAVSAFGMSGTNAHVVVEGYANPLNDAGADGVDSFAGAGRPVPVCLPESLADMPPAEEALGERNMRILPLSAKSDDALRDLASRYLAWLDEHVTEPGPGGGEASLLANAAWTAGVGRSHCVHRAGVVFRDVSSLRNGLTALAEAEGTPDEPQPATRVAFLYSGEGSQWVGMGAALYESEPVARAILDRCDAAVLDARGASLLDVMFGRAGTDGDLHAASWAPPAVYALGCALTALWASVGIRPNVVLGDGPGEIAAAQSAGVFTLEGGLRLALARGPLTTEQAALDGLETVLADVSFRPPSVALVSSVTGRVAESGSPLDGAHWRRQARETAALKARVATLADLGVDVVVEIGPGAVLAPQVRRVWPQASDSAREAAAPYVLASLLQPSGDESSEHGTGFAAAVAEAYEAGLTLSFDGLFAGESRRRVSLPGYPFQRRRHWI